MCHEAFTQVSLNLPVLLVYEFYLVEIALIFAPTSTTQQSGTDGLAKVRQYCYRHLEGKV
jgi:hypothetical protein